MDAKLVIAKGKTSVKEIPLGAEKILIGRRNDCAVRIPSPLVSRLHCELTQADDRLVVRDLGSSNGTFVNGTKVKEKELRSGDTLGVGPLTFIVQVGGVPVGAAADADDFVVDEAPAGDGADFVVADEAAVADDVVVDAEEVVAAEVVSDEAESDFVVNEGAAVGGGDGDFVVDENAAGEGADFVVDEAAAGDGADFVVNENAAADGDTIHEGNVADLFGQTEPADTEPAAEPPPEPKEEKKKGGLFSKLFKKKEKAPTAAPAPSPPPAEGRPVAAEPPAASEAESMPDFFVQDDSAQPAGAEKMGEDELADFLTGLNEKEQ
jgi:predicted component of type VI protein secretion system